MQDLNGSSVLVLGLGHSGLAMARWCARAGAAVRVADSREEPPQAEALRAALPQVTLSVGFDPALLGETESPGACVGRVLRSPGLSPRDPALAPLLARAAELGIPVQGELDLFAQALDDLKASRGYAPRLIAITGTNGKTTTTVMCGQLVEASGASVAVAGNVGPTLLDTLAAALERVDAPGGAGGEAGEPLPEVWVLELSSFQLEGVQGLLPDAAAVLNVTQDHLDWHGSMAAYAAAKARIFGPPEAWDCAMVVNRNDPQVEAMVPPPQLLRPAARGARAQTRARHVLRFGVDAPRHPGDFGIVVENGMAWLVRALESDEPPRRGRAVAGEGELHLQRLMPADALRIRGRHNAANALAALALATAIGRPLAPMLHGLREYRGEPHRVEFLARVGEVEAYDDSKGTNVGATVAALEGLGTDRAPARLVVILGGDGKGQDFTPLAQPVARHARAAALIGRDAPALQAVLAPTGVPLARHDSLEAATRWAFVQAQPGDCVLLSPACASLDMFRNYAHRAEVFAATVHALAAEQGVFA
jgi:UDP-N-acetylmuramoylalanine--D-glutamate ligase